MMKLGLGLTLSHLVLAVFAVLSSAGIFGYFAVTSWTQPILDDSQTYFELQAKDYLSTVRDCREQAIHGLFSNARKDLGLLARQTQLGIDRETEAMERLRDRCQAECSGPLDKAVARLQSIPDDQRQGIFLFKVGDDSARVAWAWNDQSDVPNVGDVIQRLRERKVGTVVLPSPVAGPSIVTYAPLDIDGGRFGFLMVRSVFEVASHVNAQSPSARPTTKAGSLEFGDFIAHEPHYDTLLLVDPAGMIRRSTNPSLLGKKAMGDDGIGGSLQATIALALEINDVAFADASTADSELTKLGPCIAKPLTSEDGQPIMLIVLQIGRRALDEILSDPHGLGRTGECLLMGDDLRLRSIPPSLTERLQATNPSGSGTVDYHVSDMVRRAFERHTPGVVRDRDAGGVETFTAYTPIEIGPGLTYGLLAAIDVQEAMENHSKLAAKAGGVWGRLIITLALALIAMAVLACLLSLFLSESIAKPIARLGTAIKRVRDGGEIGDADQHTGIAEVDDLADSLLAFVESEKQREMLRQQLLQSQKMDAIGQLAGGIAHDFNNLLSGIQGAADLLALRIEGTDDSRKFVDLIIETSQRAGDLTSRLLAFSRKDTSFSDPVDMHDVITSSVAILQRTVDKMVTIEQDLQSVQPTVIGDAGQLQSVVLNLGINARDAMPDGGTLSYTTRLVSLGKDYCDSSPFDMQPGKFIEIIVKDTGIGMPPEVQSRIFEPFFTTKDLGEGTGMGLAAVYGAVKEHHGAISVNSAVDKGTTFKVYLPVDLTAPADAPKPVEDVAVPTGQGCVMVVDDEEVVRITAGNMLRELGYKVLFATNGMEAVEMFDKYEGQVDLILLDLVMPVMDGRETLKQIWTRDPDFKVIISSGFAKDAVTAELLSPDTVGFLRKPFRRSQLAKAISAMLPSTPND